MYVLVRNMCWCVCDLACVCVCVCVRGPKSRLQDMTVKPLSGFRPNCKQAKKKNWALRQRQERKFKLLNRSRRKATGGLSSLIFPCFLYVATIFPQGYGVWGGRGVWGLVWPNTLTNFHWLHFSSDAAVDFLGVFLSRWKVCQQAENAPPLRVGGFRGSGAGVCWVGC